MALTLSATALIEEADAKKSPEIPDSIDNDYLVSLIEAATRGIEGYVGRPVIQRLFVERTSGGHHGARGGAKRIYVEHRPVVQLVSIEDDDSPVNSIDLEDVIVWKEEGILEHRLTGFPAPSVGLWNVAFNAGEAADRASAPWNYKEACRRLVAWLLNQPNPALALERLGETTLQYRSGGAVPPSSVMPESVRMLLEHEETVGI